MKKLRILSNRKIQAIIIIAVAIAVGSTFIYFHYTQVLPQTAIYFLNDVQLPAPGQKVLVFSPHPDDETIGAGGLIAESIKAGAEVRVVLVTNGNKHGLENRRDDEFKKATAILGVPEKNLIFLAQEDGKLKNQNQDILYGLFKEQIDKFNPDFIIIPHPRDIHPDHATTGKIVINVLSNETSKKTVYEYLVHDRRFPQPKSLRPGMFLLPPTNLISFDQEWRRLMLSDDIEQQKEKAIDAYRSQLKTPILRSVILSNIRKNEIFAVNGQND